MTKNLCFVMHSKGKLIKILCCWGGRINNNKTTTTNQLDREEIDCVWQVCLTDIYFVGYIKM